MTDTKDTAPPQPALVNTWKPLPIQACLLSPTTAKPTKKPIRLTE